MMDTAFDKNQFLETFAGQEKAFLAGESAWLAPVRRQAIARFGELGLPTTRLESWRYTSVKPLAKRGFRLADVYEPDGLTPSMIRKLAPLQGEGHLLVFVNGSYAEDLSRTDDLPDGVTAMSLAEAISSRREEIEPHLARHAAYEDHAFAAMNTALMQDGACVLVPRGAVVPDPIHIVHVTTASPAAPLMCFPRNLIVAAEGSQVTIVETYTSLGGAASFTNAVTEVVAGDGAVVEHYKVQTEDESSLHIAGASMNVGRNAALTSHVICLGASMCRNDLSVLLASAGGDCTLNGLYVVAGSQHVDNHTVIDHAMPQCSSREIYKGILGGRARGVFDGKVIVRPDAQKTDARQVNNNLLLSDEALVDTKPQLEINADDVKCTHAATIGQLDLDALFYMRSRAIDLMDAKSMLIRGFVYDMLDRIRIPSLRAGLETMLDRKLDFGGRIGEAS